MDNVEDKLLDCADKLAFLTKKEAMAAKAVAEFQHGTSLSVYKCQECGLWHLSSQGSV